MPFRSLRWITYPLMMLAGLGLMAGSTALAALTAILTICLVNGVVWFARLHYRLLKPALNTSSQDAARES